MGTPTASNSVQEVTDVLSSLNIDTPCAKNTSSISRLQGRVKGKILFPPPSQGQMTRWSDEELQALTAFLMLYTDGKSWVAHKDDKFWNQAGVFIQQQLKTSYCRTGKYFSICVYNLCIHLIGASCRTKATARLAKQFASPAVAEQHFSKLITSTVQSPSGSASVTTSAASVSLSTEPSVTASLQPTITTSLPPTLIFLQSFLQSISSSDPILSHSETSCMPPPPSTLHQLKDVDSVLMHCTSALVNLTVEEQFKVLTKLVSALLQKSSRCVCPDDFLELSAKAMTHLGNCHRTNVIYLMSQALGTMRPDMSDSLLPAKRMPMGLIEHSFNFFTAEHINEVHA